MDLIQFKLKGRFAHFLTAEANKELASYPVPPRTVLLGLAAAVLGLEKDRAQLELEPAFVAVRSYPVNSIWVKGKFHKSLSPGLDYKIRQNAKGETAEMKNQKILNQEWLINPEWDIWVNLPDPFHSDFCRRLERRAWHFSPYLGISEHSADLLFEGHHHATALASGTYRIMTVMDRSRGTPDYRDIMAEGLSLQFLSMPAVLTQDRVFTHRRYMFEKSGLQIPVQTESAWQANGSIITAL